MTLMHLGNAQMLSYVEIVIHSTRPWVIEVGVSILCRLVPINVQVLAVVPDNAVKDSADQQE